MQHTPDESPTSQRSNQHGADSIRSNERESVTALEAAATELEGTNVRFQELWGKLCSPLSPNPAKRRKLLQKLHSEFGFFLGDLEIGFDKHASGALQVRSGNEELIYNGVAEYPGPSSTIILQVGEGYEGRMYSIGINNGRVNPRYAMRAAEMQSRREKIAKAKAEMQQWQTRSSLRKIMDFVTGEEAPSRPVSDCAVNMRTYGEEVQVMRRMNNILKKVIAMLEYFLDPNSYDPDLVEKRAKEKSLGLGEG